MIGTTNSGITWQPESVPSGVGTLTAVSCVSASICHAVSDFGSGSPSIIATSDGGSVWSPESFPAMVTDFTGISCVDSQHCTAVGSSSGGPDAAILSTTNGGATWTPQTVPTGVTTLDGISCTGDETCLATGSQVVRTVDGGSQWNDLGSPAGTTPLAAISCISASDCTAAGGTSIVDTTTGGTSWTSRPRPPGSASSSGCRAPARRTARRSAPAPTLAARSRVVLRPPSRPHRSPSGPSACPTRARSGRAVVGALFVGRDKRRAPARARSRTERHHQRHSDGLRNTRSRSP